MYIDQFKISTEACIKSKELLKIHVYVFKYLIYLCNNANVPASVQDAFLTVKL